MNQFEEYARRAQMIRFLKAEIRSKTRRRARHASIAVVGFPRTGKKTLARRFGAMNEGPFEEEVPSRYYYMAYVDLDARHTNGTGDVFIRTYVVPPPLDLPVENPPRYFREVHNLSAIVFICSVVDKSSFDKIVNRIHELRLDLYREGLPYFLIVGNKRDLNRREFPDHFGFQYGLLTTRNHFGTNYEECSAKQNINVDIILEEILLQIIAQQR